MVGQYANTMYARRSRMLPFWRQASGINRNASGVPFRAQLLPRIGRAAGGKEAESAIDGGLRGRFRKSRRNGQQVGGERCHEEDEKQTQGGFEQRQITSG